MQRSITIAELQALMGREVALTLCDVRRTEARAEDPVAIEGAAWFDPESVDAWGDTLDPGVEIVVYCVHGHAVSQSVADALRAKGLRARFVEGGLEAWKQAGGATEPRA